MAISRGNSLLMKKQWAEDGSTVIPNPPVAGTTYRDESVDADNIAEGQQYDGVADSARWNQFLYIITGILKDTLAHGVLPWLNTQDYSEGAVVMGSNGTLYIAKKANGPTSSNAKDPTTDSAESVWKAIIRLNAATMALDSAGKILTKDIAIGGDTSDLASERGLFSSINKGSADYNTLITQGFYSVNQTGSPNGPGFAAKVLVLRPEGSSYITQIAFSITGSRLAVRGTQESTSNWSSWVQFISTDTVGDGIKVNNGSISVPEYVGATSSKPGTAGLVPPATAAERDKFLKGDGTYDSIGEGVYVKKTGDTLSGNLNIEFKGNSGVAVRNYGFEVTDLSKGATPSQAIYARCMLYGKDQYGEVSGALAGVIMGITPDNTTFTELRAFKNKSGTDYSAALGIRCKPDGTQETYTVDPSSDSNDRNLATTKWVNSKLGKSIMPVGAVYVQFANQPAPTSLFGGTWSNISNSYAGLFFRAEGGAAAAFGGTQSDGAPDITGWTEQVAYAQFCTGYTAFKTKSVGGCSVSGDGHNIAQLEFMASRSSSKYGAATEVRPVNSTIRIWKRTK